ncbi:hypothetical protein ACYX8G_19590 [Microbacterium saperdae]
MNRPTADRPTQQHMILMLALRWRQRDLRGVWFWGSWILTRWRVFPILTFGIALPLASALVAGWAR